MTDWHKHKDFKLGGLLHRGTNYDFSKTHPIAEIFPPEKKDSFLNYMLLIHPEPAGVWLAWYAYNILENRWAEAEKHIFKDTKNNRYFFSFIQHYIDRLDVPSEDLPEWVLKQLNIKG